MSSGRRASACQPRYTPRLRTPHVPYNGNAGDPVGTARVRETSEAGPAQKNSMKPLAP